MIGMLLALVVLAAAFLGIRQYNKNASSATSTTEDTQETVLDVNSDDITSFRYVYEGETYAFEKKDETWYYTDDHSLNLNQERIKAMILKVAPLKADQVIENVTDMSQYGLADPERTIQYETADRSVIINVGNLNSMTSQYYIAFPSEMKVYVVATNVVTGFNYTLEWKRLPKKQKVSKRQKLQKQKPRKLWRLWKRKLQRRKQIRNAPHE